MFNARPGLRAYRHVAIVPAEFSTPLDADAVLTWADLADLSRAVLGSDHYVTLRLRNAVDRYQRVAGEPGVRNYDGILPLDAILLKCAVESEIEVGHTGGENALVERGLSYAQSKAWKWRDPRVNEGVAEQRNWIRCDRFAHVIESMSAGKARTPAGEISNAPVKNYDGVLSFEEVIDLARERGNSIQVGHTGGEADLRIRGLPYMRGKRWKWRDPKTNRGIAQANNWIGAERFIRLCDRL